MDDPGSDIAERDVDMLPESWLTTLAQPAPATVFMALAIVPIVFAADVIGSFAGWATAATLLTACATPFTLAYRPWGLRVLDGAADWVRVPLRRLPRHHCDNPRWRRCWMGVLPADYLPPADLLGTGGVTARLVLTGRDQCLHLYTDAAARRAFTPPARPVG